MNLKVIKNNKSNIGLSTVALIIIVLIGGLLVISIIAYVFGAFTDPNKIEDGIKCRLMIQTSARLQEVTQGLTPEKIADACPTLEKTIPLRDNYPTLGGRVDKIKDPVDLKNVVMWDFAELINNARWITGEGDRSDYLVKELKGIFVGENNCYVVYAIRIDTPRKFIPITELDLQKTLQKITRADIKGGSLKGDKRKIAEYITLDGKGAGVFLKTKDSKIEYQEEGANPFYGIAVGFADESGLTKAWKALLGERPEPINKDASFIYIAPYKEVALLCKVI